MRKKENEEYFSFFYLFIPFFLFFSGHDEKIKQKTINKIQKQRKRDGKKKKSKNKIKYSRVQRRKGRHNKQKPIIRKLKKKRGKKKRADAKKVKIR